MRRMSSLATLAFSFTLELQCRWIMNSMQALLHRAGSLAPKPFLRTRKCSAIGPKARQVVKLVGPKIRSACLETSYPVILTFSPRLIIAVQNMMGAIAAPQRRTSS
jgi:hypothetical protein